jgi:L-ribulose-5-phosphate 3-epimerase/hexulose-6-phosphate isomerase
MDLNKIPIGIYEKALPNTFSWEEKFIVAKSAGFDFIEMSIDESDERLKRLDWGKEEKENFLNFVNNYEVKCFSMCLSGHRRFPFGSKDPVKREEAYNIMKKAIKLASDLNIRVIQLAGYDVYYEESDGETKKLFIEGLRHAVKWASRASVMLAIEIMDTEFIGTITRANQYIDLVNSPWLKIYPDLGNLSRWTNNPSKELELGKEHIVAIHIKDTKPGIFKCVPFGQGTVEFVDLFKTLQKIDYNGPFLIEMWADNNKSYTKEEAIKEIETARKWALSQMDQGGYKYVRAT